MEIQGYLSESFSQNSAVGKMIKTWKTMTNKLREKREVERKFQGY